MVLRRTAALTVSRSASALRGETGSEGLLTEARRGGTSLTIRSASWSTSLQPSHATAAQAQAGSRPLSAPTMIPTESVQQPYHRDAAGDAQGWPAPHPGWTAPVAATRPGRPRACAAG